MTITALPTPPSRQDPVNFAAHGDAFMAALPAFATEANALAEEVNAAAAEAANDAVALAIAATSASFVNATSSQTVNGVKTFTSSPVLPGDATTALQAVPKQQVDAAASAAAPAGAVSFFARSTAPTGWIKANGAAISRTTYDALFAAIGTTFGAGDGTTTFNLPDLRGEFIRSLDDSRGVDSGRALGSAQADQNKEHNHGGATGGHSASHTHSGTTSNQSSGHDHNSVVLSGYSVAAGSGLVNGVQSGSTGFNNQNHNHSFTTGSASNDHTHTISSDGGTEVRVRNVAMLACIKY